MVCADVPRFIIGGVPIAAMDMPGFTAAVTQWVSSRDARTPGAYVCFRDAHGVIIAQDDPAVMAAHRRAFLVVPDGRPLMWVGRRRGHATTGQVSGIAAVERLCIAGAAAGWRHYFLGGAPGVAAKLAAAMAARVPGLIVAGAESPPFTPLSAHEARAQCDRILAARTDLLWVGLGSPKQDLWMAANAAHLPRVLALGVGAAFDVYTGRFRRAPRWMQTAGLEWAYRLALEPRRLWPRYSRVVPRFAALVLREEFGFAPNDGPGE